LQFSQSTNSCTLLRLQALQILEELVLEGSKDIDLRSKDAVAKKLKGAISSKISGWVLMWALHSLLGCMGHHVAVPFVIITVYILLSGS
jgi:hypothetical protein